jgi:hypothetical protein
MKSRALSAKNCSRSHSANRPALPGPGRPSPPSPDQPPPLGITRTGMGIKWWGDAK